MGGLRHLDFFQWGFEGEKDLLLQGGSPFADRYKLSYGAPISRVNFHPSCIDLRELGILQVQKNKEK